MRYGESERDKVRQCSEAQEKEENGEVEGHCEVVSRYDVVGGVWIEFR